MVRIPQNDTLMFAPYSLAGPELGTLSQNMKVNSGLSTRNSVAQNLHFSVLIIFFLLVKSALLTATGQFSISHITAMNSCV